MEVDTYERNGLTVRISYDTDAESPREWDNVGTMICSHRDYTFGDTQLEKDNFDSWADVKQWLTDTMQAVVILPLSIYDHSGVTMYVSGTHQHEAWDSSQVGFIYCTQEAVDREWNGDLTQAERYLRGEVEDYDQYLRGDIYGFTITNPVSGEEVDSCWGIYGLSQVRSDANEAADGYVWPRDAVYAKNAREIHG